MDAGGAFWYIDPLAPDGLPTPLYCYIIIDLHFSFSVIQLRARRKIHLVSGKDVL